MIRLSRSAFVTAAAALAARSSSSSSMAAAFSVLGRLAGQRCDQQQHQFKIPPHPASSTRRYMSSFDPSEVPINRVQKDAFSQIIDEYEAEGREGSGYVVIDVRGEEEIAVTGKVSPNTITLPLPLIAQQGAFNMDDDDFEEAFGFAKPTPDETLVFTCKAGVRSYYGAQYAAMAGYTKLFDYIGGADEWFR